MSVWALAPDPPQIGHLWAMSSGHVMLPETASLRLCERQTCSGCPLFLQNEHMRLARRLLLMLLAERRRGLLAAELLLEANTVDWW